MVQLATDLWALSTPNFEKLSDQLCDCIEKEYLAEQVTAEKEVGDLLTKMKRTGSEGLGLHIIDKELQG